MANLVGKFIAQTHRRTIFILMWALTFAVVLVLLIGFTTYWVGESMRAETTETLDEFAALRAKVVATLDVLDEQVTAAPCSSEFHLQLHKVAYLPDGLNEFLYVPDGVAQCSVKVGRFVHPVDLGVPDIDLPNPFGLKFWMDRDLGFLDLDGVTGSIVARGSFATIVPGQRLSETRPRWMTQEVVLLLEDGRWWHRAGEAGVFERVRSGSGGGPFVTGTFDLLSCPPGAMHCVAAEATVPHLFALGMGTIAIGVVGAGLLSAWLASGLIVIITRYWSFEARFRRNFNANTVICLYQPIISVATGQVAGCEVLVRWRDFDGTTVAPDRFLPIVERHRMTMMLTELVIHCAARELSKHLHLERRLMVFINVFPRDLDSKRLIEALSPFDAVRHRFDLVLELVENDQVSTDIAQREIEALRTRGIRTFIDDFGTGYSNIQNLAALSVDGVKLDRAFAMSPDGSLMARLLINAIEMIHGSGCAVVVEGIETAERLRSIRATGRVEYAQGFHISRPIEIMQMAKFLDSREMDVPGPPPAAVKKDARTYSSRDPSASLASSSHQRLKSQ